MTPLSALIETTSRPLARTLSYMALAALLAAGTRAAVAQTITDAKPVPSDEIIRQMVAASEPEVLRRYQITIHGEGNFTFNGTPEGRNVGTTFVDLRIERRSVFGDAVATAGFHTRAFFSTKDVTDGNTPSMSSILKLIEGYLEVIPDGADGIHVFRANVGNTWVAFGYGADERASFTSFPLASSLSTASIGFAPNATLSYENRELGFTIEGSLLSPQENGSYFELENQGYTIRARKGIPITTHLRAEIMASYANLYYPTRDERDQRVAVGAKISAQLGNGVALEGLAEVFGQRAMGSLGAREAAGWLAMVRITKGRATVGVRYSHARTENLGDPKNKHEWTVAGRYTVTRPTSRVKLDVTAEAGRLRTQSSLSTDSRSPFSVGIVLSRGAKKKRK